MSESTAEEPRSPSPRVAATHVALNTVVMTVFLYLLGRFLFGLGTTDAALKITALIASALVDWGVPRLLGKPGPHRVGLSFVYGGWGPSSRPG